MSTRWLEPVPDSQCRGHRDLSTNLSAKNLTLLYQPGILGSGPVALPQLSQKRPSKIHSNANPLSAGEGFQLCCPQSDGMELTAIATAAGQEILLLCRIYTFIGGTKRPLPPLLCSGDTVGFVRSHSTDFDKAKMVPSGHPAVILLPSGDPDFSIQAKPTCQ